MAYAYGRQSKARLDTCHPLLQKLFYALAEDWDISIICGHRTEEEQNQAIANKASKTEYPNSKHNAYPSLGIDAALYPIDWDDSGRHYMFAGMVKQKAKDLGIDVRGGCDWDSDNNTDDQTFNDLVHWELVL